MITNDSTMALFSIASSFPWRLYAGGWRLDSIGWRLEADWLRALRTLPLPLALGHKGHTYRYHKDYCRRLPFHVDAEIRVLPNPKVDVLLGIE